MCTGRLRRLPSFAGHRGPAWNPAHRVMLPPPVGATRRRPPPTSCSVAAGDLRAMGRRWKTRRSCRDDGQTSSARRVAAARPWLLPFARSSLAASTSLGGASTRRASAVVGSKTLAAFTAPAGAPRRARTVALSVLRVGACPASLVTVALRRILHSVDNSASGRFGFTALRAASLGSGPWLLVYSVQLAGLRTPRVGAFVA